MEFSQLALTLFFTGAEKLAPILLTQGANYLKNKSQNDKIDAAIEIVENLIRTNVVAAESTLKIEAMKAIEDGKIDKSELSQIAVIVGDNVLKQLGTSIRKLIEDKFGDIKQYIAEKIEEILNEVKNKTLSMINEDGTLNINAILPA